MKCAKCEGTGRIQECPERGEWNFMDCPTCKGTGVVSRTSARRPYCKRCSKCCTVLCLHMSAIKHDRKWVEGRQGFIKGMFAYIPSVCKWLNPKTKLCMVQGEKPDFCQGFPDEPGDWLLNMGCKFYD